MNDDNVMLVRLHRFNKSTTRLIKNVNPYSLERPEILIIRGKWFRFTGDSGGPGSRPNLPIFHFKETPKPLCICK